jgi:TetR/AcrR family transcriptional regulator, repressor for neighboring sulfatase
MTDAGDKQPRRGREATTAAILDAAAELFSERGYAAVSVREVATRAGVSHALVHRYLGGKAELFRAVLTQREDAILAAAPGNPDLLESTSLMLRQGLEHGRSHIRLIVRSALGGLPYERTTGSFAATERLIELAERAAASASASERAEKSLDPRIAVAGVVALFLGWAATESWLRPAAGLESMDDDELLDGIERMILDILRVEVPGLESDPPASR